MTRVLFFGMTGEFSIPPLEKLIVAGVDLCAVVTPASPSAAGPLPRRLEPPPVSSDLPIVNPHFENNIMHLAWKNNIPVWAVGSLSDGPTLEMLATLAPDLIVVACFPHIFPRALLQLPPQGCLNLHPSLLPAYRGPAPLFWMARQGEPLAGVTLHFLDEGIDRGDLVAQTAFEWPDGISGTELERRCALEGAALLQAAMQQLEQGPLPRQAQPVEGASYFPWPSEKDFGIPTWWSARRAFNFLRAAGEWPLTVEVDRERFPIRAAIDYDTNQTLEQPYISRDNEMWIQFAPGVLRVQV